MVVVDVLPFEEQPRKSAAEMRALRRMRSSVSWRWSIVRHGARGGREHALDGAARYLSLCNKMVISLPGDVLFDSGKDTLKKDGQDILKKGATILRADKSLGEREMLDLQSLSR